MRNLLLLTLLIIFYSINVSAQATLPQVVKTNIDGYSAAYPQEKIYIHYDKAAYAPGETVWFKAYIMKGADISDLSKSFYVDFTDADGNLLQHSVYPVVQASASGSFTISDNFKDKSLHVHAYTKWMLNFDSTFLYDKDIRILAKAGGKADAKPSTKVVVQFFPEGGDCVAGLKTKVAFKATNQNGLPVAITGTVTDSKGGFVDSIITMHDGMGFFYIEAQEGETYTAKYTDKALVDYETTLPAVKAVGASLEIRPGKLRTGFIVRRTDNAPDNMKQMHIVATMQQQVVYTAGVNLDATPFTSGTIPMASLPTGILQVTLFDAAWVPLAERICFVNKNDYRFEPKVDFEVQSAKKRGKNVLVIDVADSAEANMSVSVTDAGLGVDSSDDIISHLLVTGDLKGRVYNPSYYFSENNDRIAADIDLVMLTNGWRRFNWAQAIAGSRPEMKYAPDTAWLNFKGAIEGARPEQIREAGTFTAVVSTQGHDSARSFITIPLKNDGSFNVPGFIFFDSLKVYYQIKSKAGLKLSYLPTVNFNMSGLPRFSHLNLDKNKLSYAFFDTSGNYRSSMIALQEAKLQELLKTTTLQGVTLKTKAKSRLRQLDEMYTGGRFRGGDVAAQFDMLNDKFAGSSPDVLTYLVGKVPGLLISGQGTPDAEVGWEGRPVRFFIDEIGYDLDMVNNLNMNDIAYIKVLRSSVFTGLGGSIAIYTRRGTDVKEMPDKDAKLVQYKAIAGYNSVKEFYSPNYDTANQANAQPDGRTTLYWDPMVLTNAKKHKAKLVFFNNDFSDKLRVVIEGVNAEGKLTRMVKFIQ